MQQGDGLIDRNEAHLCDFIRIRQRRSLDGNAVEEHDPVQVSVLPELCARGEQILDLCLDADLLADLTEDPLLRRFTKPQESAGKGPPVLRQTPIPENKQDLAVFETESFDDDTRHRCMDGGPHPRGHVRRRRHVVLARPLVRMRIELSDTEPDVLIKTERSYALDVEGDFLLEGKIQPAIPADEEDATIAFYVAAHRITAGHCTRSRGRWAALQAAGEREDNPVVGPASRGRERSWTVHRRLRSEAPCLSWDDRKETKAVDFLFPSQLEETAEGENGALPRSPLSVIALLQAVQERFGYISERRLEDVAEYTGAPVSTVYGVTTFYAQFRLQPPGKHLIRVCRGTACHVLGAGEVLTTLQEELGVSEDETTGDGLFTLESVRCLGCCSLAPAIMIDEAIYGRVTREALPEILEPYRGGGSA